MSKLKVITYLNEVITLNIDSTEINANKVITFAQHQGRAVVSFHTEEDSYNVILNSETYGEVTRVGLLKDRPVVFTSDNKILHLSKLGVLATSEMPIDTDIVTTGGGKIAIGNKLVKLIVSIGDDGEFVYDEITRTRFESLYKNSTVTKAVYKNNNIVLDLYDI